MRNKTKGGDFRMAKKVDLTGRTFYDLYVEKEGQPQKREDGRYNRTWHCICICGKELDVPTSSLTTGNTKSCGCRRTRKPAVKRRDLTGQTFNDLHVDSKANDIVQPSGQHKSAWNCTCVCGKKTVVSQNALITGTTKSCGCRNIKNGIARRIDLSGKRYHMLTVESFAYMHTTPSGQHVSYWNCVCDCGNRKQIRGTSLKSGYATSCGCYKKKYLADTRTIDLTGMKIGRLYVKGRSVETPYDNKRKRALWDCVCDCGRNTVMPSDKLLSGHTMSCGCLGSSKGENEVAILLDKMNVKYIHWYAFDDLRGKRNMPLPFDFAILGNEGELLGLIEFQGEQHYIEKPRGFGDVQRLRTDPMKRAYCKRKNIPLYEIRFDADIPTGVNDALNYIFSYVNTVPSGDIAM